MKSSLALMPFLGLAMAAPAPRVLPVKRQYTGVDTENQLTDGTPCRELTIIFARGTTEPGNVGTLAGPPFFQAVANMIGASNVAVQGVSLTSPMKKVMDTADSSQG